MLWANSNPSIFLELLVFMWSAAKPCFPYSGFAGRTFRILTEKLCFTLHVLLFFFFFILAWHFSPSELVLNPSFVLQRIWYPCQFWVVFRLGKCIFCVIKVINKCGKAPWPFETFLLVVTYALGKILSIFHPFDLWYNLVNMVLSCLSPFMRKIWEMISDALLNPRYVVVTKGRWIRDDLTAHFGL